jgi:hypothetical protein
MADSGATAKPFNHFYQGVAPTGEYRFFQIAWIVDDLMTTIRKWVEVYGVGPFHVMPSRKARARYRGEEVEFEMQLAVVQSGPVQLEFIQQKDDLPSVYREVYPPGTGGVHHTRAHYERLGYPSIAQIIGAMRVEYFDTRKDFGFITELVENNEIFVGHLRNHARICAEWDGRDPIRFLTRDGYRTPEQMQR